MRKLIYLIVLVTGLLLSTVALAGKHDRYPFSTAAERSTFVRLTEELRCMVCQNQNLADSNADLAVDLREQVYKAVREGQSHDQVIRYMTDRYGDFILFNPPVKSSTMILWFAPFFFLLLGMLVVFRLSRRTTKEMPSVLEPKGE